MPDLFRDPAPGDVQRLALPDQELVARVFTVRIYPIQLAAFTLQQNVPTSRFMAIQMLIRIRAL